MSSLTSDIRPFDVCGPLPTGVTVLEASAGTGKTFTIAALAARYVAEGTPLEQLLLVTFTRMATGELRERVRERLVSAEQGLDRALAGAPPQDEVVALLAKGTQQEVTQRRERLTRALADFDAATIATTHGFCQEVLGGLGVAGDVDPDATFVEDVSDLLADVVDDLYVRRWHGSDEPQFDRAQAMRIARIAVDNPAVRVEPENAPGHTVEAMRRRLALAVRDELERRKRQMAVMTYDDLLTRLDDTLKGPGGEAAAKRLRERYRVVLVDEFQDTDPVQWDIMRRAFGDGDTTLVLIGDPKQAIYAFRGADVYAYLEAANRADKRATLEVNWRSDQGLIDAYDALLGGAKLGHEGIVYRRVRAADANQTPRLHDAPVAAPLRIRVVHRDEPSLKLTRGGSVSNASAREHVAKDLAADLATLLSSNAEDRDPRAGRHGAGRPERIRPGHVAVLVRTHRNAALIRDALDEVDIPAVINGAGSVFGTAPARDWLRLLEAIERPSSPARAASAALTPFLGWTTERVASATEEDREELHRRLHQWARVLRVKGVASLTETVTLVEGLPQRVLQTIDGERELTDLRHVGQLLHAAATTEQMGAAALTSWLRQQIAAAGEDTSDEERSRRLESDAEAVQVLTIHRSKGVEFPIVYYPYLWEPGWIPNDPQPVFFHDPQAGDERVIDVGMDGPDFPAHRRQHEAEQRGEDLRLAYVALTRAQHQAVVWWAPSWDSRNSALGRLLFARDAEGNVPPAGPATPKDAEAVARFEGLAARRVRVRQRRARDARAGHGVGGRGDTGRGALRRALRPRPRLALAAHVLQRHHRRRLRGAGGERARGARRRRRGDDLRAPAAGAARRRRPGVGRDARRAVAARRRCRSASRSAPSCTASSRRPTSPRPTSTPSSASTSRRPSRAGASTSATRRRRWPGCAPPSRRRSARCSAAARCETSSAPTASTSSSSSCRSSAATSRPGA